MSGLRSGWFGLTLEHLSELTTVGRLQVVITTVALHEVQRSTPIGPQVMAVRCGCRAFASGCSQSRAAVPAKHRCVVLDLGRLISDCPRVSAGLLLLGALLERDLPSGHRRSAVWHLHVLLNLQPI